MKFTKLFTAGSFALLASSVFGEEPVIPTGFLDASSLMVRASSNVDLNWEVNIPASEVEDLIEIPEDEPTIIAKEDVGFEVRMLGVEYAHKGDYVLAHGHYTYAGGEDGESPWYTFFWGYGDDEDALTKKTCDILKAGEELQFSFRGSKNGFRNMPSKHRKWFDNRWSGTGPKWYDNETPAIILKNGDMLPERATPSGQVDVSSFLSAYLERDGKTVKIGPKDLIILAELNRNRGDRQADYQDFVILVSFTEAANTTCTRRWNGPTPPPVVTIPEISRPLTPSIPTTGETPRPAPEPIPEPEIPEVPGLPE